MPRPWLSTSLALLLACGGESAAPLEPGAEEPPTDAEPSAENVRMGPLANAGPDQRALPGMVVRLDARGTIPPEDGRPFRVRWLQESGPRVLLSDPRARIAEFVAPPIRPGGEDRLSFRLVADDGALRSEDRVAVELVEDGARLVSAPAAVGGADLEVAPGEELEIPSPAFADPSCLEAEDPAACLAEPLPFCWTQVAGPSVDLLGACGEEPTTLVAPARESVLVFRLDAHAEGLHGPAACGPEALVPSPSPLCAAPDYLRVVVRETARRDAEPPSTSLRVQGEERDRVEIVPIGGPASEIPAAVDLAGGGVDPARWRLVPRYRPVLGTLSGSHEANPLRLAAPPWPGPVGVAFDPWFYRHHTQGGQTRMEWFRAAPSLAIVVWTPPWDTAPLRASIAGHPCGGASPAGSCEPIAPAEEVVLVGQFEGSGAQGCWEQTFGPPVDLTPSQRCAAGLERRFIAPSPIGEEPVELAFRFSVRDASPYESPPATLWLQIRPEEVLPPIVELEIPDDLEPGESVELDASPSLDPQGGPLRFRWRRIGGASVGLRSCDDLAQEACMVLTAPLDAAGSATLELEVGSEASGLITRRRIVLPIVEAP